MIVDFHTHYFSRTYFETLAQQSPRTEALETKLEQAAAKAKIEIPHPDPSVHFTRWQQELERHSIEHISTFASVPEETPVVVDAARRSLGRMSAFALVNPKAPGVLERIEPLLAAKDIRGVLMLPALHHFEIDGPEARAVFRALDAAGAIAYVHCGVLIVKLRDLLGLPRAADLRYANPLQLIPVANAHPRAHFVIPHFGAGFFREALIAGAQCPNVYVDTSSSNGWTSTQWPKPTLAQVFERALEVFGTQRILFGTDSNVFPAGWRRDRYEEQKAALDSLGASVADHHAVFSGNAKRLLGI